MPLATGVDENRPAIVFVHGFLGFATIRLALITIHYFRNLPANLKHLAAACFFPQVPPAGAVAERAHCLATFLASLRHEPIFLVAHSMGGLDSRYLIHHLDPEKRIRALVTVATPHHGTPLATWFQQDNSWIAHAGRKIASPALHDLTPMACERFNKEVSDRPDVRYFSYAGCRQIREISRLFRPWARMLQENAGDNDSQVPVSSARWGEFLGLLRADHLESAGWSFALPNKRQGRPFDHIAFYRKIVGDLLAMEQS